MRVTISGPPGSGKTTVCRLLGERLGMEVVVSGHIFRQMARERNMSLAEFGAMCELDPAADRSLDERMVQVAREKEHVCLEGRLTAYMLTRQGIDALRVFMDASIDERAKRVAEREGGSAEQRRSEIEEREACEAKRYLAYYNIDVSDKGVYDLIIDTTILSPSEVADAIVKAAEVKYDQDAG